MSDKEAEKSEMSELTWASEALQSRIAPTGSAQYVETRIRLAANALRWKFSRARDVWYADPRVSIKPRELRKIEEVAGIRYGQQEIRDINSIINQADALLDGPEADFYRPFVVAVRAMASAFYRPGTPRDGGHGQ